MFLYLYFLLRKLPIQLLICLVLALSLASFFSHHQVCQLYTLSTLFLDILMMILPLMVFVYIFSAILSMEQNSPIVIGVMFIMITLSNASALWVAYGLGCQILPNLSIPVINNGTIDLTLQIVSLVSIPSAFKLGTDKAMMLAIIGGIGCNFLPVCSKARTHIHKLCYMCRDYITVFLQNFFLPLLPLYVFGFLIKLAYTKALTMLIHQYAQIFAVSSLIVIFYITSLYLLAAKGQFKQTWIYIKNMLPAGLTGLSTLSSAATLPVSLACTRRNLKDNHFPDLVIPVTANIHMLGDDITIVIVALSMLIMQGQELPNIMTFAPFVVAFCVAKLSCVGVPGASVLVVLPVLQSHLGFSTEMISLLTTLYILQDALGTCANVMGNGGFALILHKIYKRIQKLKN